MPIFCGLVVSVAIFTELARYRRMCMKRTKLEGTSRVAKKG